MQTLLRFIGCSPLRICSVTVAINVVCSLSSSVSSPVLVSINSNCHASNVKHRARPSWLDRAVAAGFPHWRSGIWMRRRTR